MTDKKNGNLVSIKGGKKKFDEKKKRLQESEQQKLVHELLCGRPEFKEKYGIDIDVNFHSSYQSY